MRILYFGTAAIGIPLLRRCDTLWDVVGVVTAPDKPWGRGKRLKPSPVKEVGLGLGLEVYEPGDVNASESLDWCCEKKPDAFVLFAYAQILSRELLSVPRWAINVHPSLLPRYRGAAPLQRALMAGDSETGISIIQMEARVDAGGILMQETLPIESDDTYGDLAEHISRAAPYLIECSLKGLKEGTLTPKPQSIEGITSAPKIGKKERTINWEKPAGKVHDLIRALSPEPLAYTWFRNKRLDIVRARIADLQGSGIPGTLVSVEKRLMTQCGTGFVELLEIKPEGKRKMEARAFVNGYRPTSQDVLGRNIP
ncbi:methionyl-tRNA formyltransferase [candidate division WOR-3 bacterium]|nr:methionyl-tRNA formyltransferase [candidate division WOR-3 bacterium]